MFDLEKAIAAWRRSLTFNRTFQAEDVDELERHLRDQVRDLVEEGMSQEAAFRRAREQFGQYGEVEREYRKVRWESLSSRGRTLEELGARWAMLMNYFRVAFRSFRRHPLYFGLNLGGLTIGMAAALLIMLFIRHELSYDSGFSNADRVYRLAHMNERTQTSALLGPTLLADFPEIEAFTRISQRIREVRVESSTTVDVENRFFYADSTFFSVLDFPLVQGNPEHLLSNPFSVVVTEKIAKKYFGDEEPIGQTLEIESFMGSFEFTVEGVAADMTGNTHFEFDFLASFETRYRIESERSLNNWYSIDSRTYILLASDVGIDTILNKMEDFAKRHYPDRIKFEGNQAFSFQPLRSIHLHSNLNDEWMPNGDPRTNTIYLWIAGFVLCVAGLNYINMATARSVARAREVGVRKVVGAAKGQLMMQFYMESFIVVTASGLLAYLLAFGSLPWFADLTGQSLLRSQLLDGPSLALFAGFTIAGAILAGSYPAIVLSGFRPIQTIKGLAIAKTSNAQLRKALVFNQFVLSIILVFGTGILTSQLAHLQDTRLGMNPDQVLVIQNHDAFESSTIQVFKDRLRSHSAIVSASSVSTQWPVNVNSINRLYEYRPDGVWTEEELARWLTHFGVDDSFVETMEIDLIAGRDFLPVETGPEKDPSYLPTIINQQAVEMLGWEDPIGMELGCCFRPTPRVVGVVADFQFESAKNRIRPMAMTLGIGNGHTMLRVASGSASQAIEHVESIWNEMAPEWPLEYAFLNDHFAAAYTAEQRLARSFKLFSILAVIIACLGLFGLSTLMVHSRVREIGIRKVVGASAERVVGLLMGDLLRPILLALIVAMPLAWWLAGRWLQDFPYRIDLGIAPFAQTAVLTLLVAVVTISWHTWRAAHINPADAIRYE